MKEFESIYPLLSKADFVRELDAVEQPYAARYRASIRDLQAEIQRLTDLLAWQEDCFPFKLRFKTLGKGLWVIALKECYARATRSKDRHRFVFEAIKEARTCAIARQLGVEALRDRSYSVRMRAHQVLAYGLDAATLPALRASLREESRQELKDSLKAAINAVTKQNHHLYVDREERGNAHWNVAPWENDDPAVQRGLLNYLLSKTREGWEKAV